MKILLTTILSTILILSSCSSTQAKNYVIIKSIPSLTVPDFKEEKVKDVSFVASIDSHGKVKDISTCNPKKKLCEYYKEKVRQITFKPAYDPQKKEFLDSFTYIVILFDDQNSPELLNFPYKIGTVEGVNSIGLRNGDLNPKKISEVIKKKAPEFKKCYNKALETNQNLSGNIFLNLIIGKTGDVLISRVSRSGIKDLKTQKCFEEAGLKMKFPELKNGDFISIGLPFILNTKDKKSKGTNK